jgi:hypothetical protein
VDRPVEYSVVLKIISIQKRDYDNDCTYDLLQTTSYSLLGEIASDNTLAGGRVNR